jgi:hypothetical protein
MNTRTVFRAWLFAIAVASLFFLPGCVAVPLGDPAKSTADSRLFGVWEWRDGHINRAVVRPWDRHTYVVDVLTGDPTGDGTAIAPRSRNVFKGWLTDVAGESFLTMQPIDTMGTVNGDDRKPSYLVVRIKFDGATLTASGIQPDFKPIQDAKTSAELEKAIAANLDNPKLFAAPIVTTHWNTDQMKGLDKLQETFRELKQP